MDGDLDEDGTDDSRLDRRSILRTTAVGAAGAVALGVAADPAAGRGCDAETYCNGDLRFLEVCCPGEPCETQFVGYC